MSNLATDCCCPKFAHKKDMGPHLEKGPNEFGKPNRKKRPKGKAQALGKRKWPREKVHGLITNVCLSSPRKAQPTLEKKRRKSLSWNSLQLERDERVEEIPPSLL